MDFKQLKALITVAETGNVTRASTLLNIVQPAVSRQLRLLEQDVGTSLFDRSRHRMELTDAGKTLVEYARRVMNELDRARAESAPHGLRSLVENAATLMGLQLRVVAETNAMSVQKSLVLGGHGWTVFPTIAVVDDMTRGILTASPLVKPSLTRKIVLALPNNRQTTPSVRCVITALVDCMRQAIHRGDWRAARWLAG